VVISPAANGAYVTPAVLPYGWTGNIVPSKQDYTFTPASRSVTAPLAANLVHQDFSALANWTISGIVTDPSGKGLGGIVLKDQNGVTVAVSSSSPKNAGEYIFIKDVNWHGTITPFSKPQYNFSPASRSYFNVFAANLPVFQTRQDYTAASRAGDR